MERMTIPCGPGCLEVDAQWRQALCSSGSLSSQVRGLVGLVYPKRVSVGAWGIGYLRTAAGSQPAWSLCVHLS